MVLYGLRRFCKNQIKGIIIVKGISAGLKLNFNRSSDSSAGLWAAAPAAAAVRESWPLFVRGILLAPCAELVELWRIAFRVSNGTFFGWRTLTVERAAFHKGHPCAVRSATSAYTPRHEVWCWRLPDSTSAGGHAPSAGIRSSELEAY